MVLTMAGHKACRAWLAGAGAFMAGFQVENRWILGRYVPQE